MAVTFRLVKLGDQRLHVAEAGPADGPLVILLHGFPEYWGAWRHQIPALAAAGFRVLAPDQRGYNLSSQPRRLAGYGLDALVDDVVALIAEAGHDRAHVVGHDWGGLVAWWAAIREPEKLRRLGILNVGHPRVLRQQMRSNPRQRRKSWYVFFFQLPWLPEWYLSRGDWEKCVRAVRGTSRKGTFSPADMDEYRQAWRRSGARGMVNWYRAALRRPPRRVPSLRVTVPTLLLWGARDRFLGEELVKPSLDLCDRARAEIFPEATHWIQHEEPEKVNRALIDFFS